MNQKEVEIINAAKVLFGQFGLKKITTDDIAREARISKATIYKYYKNKDQIFDEVVEREADQLLQEIKDAVEKAPTVKLKFKAHLFTRMEKIGDFVNFYRVTRESWGDFWPHIANVRQRFLRGEAEIVKDILKLGIQTDQLRVKNVDLASYIMVVGLASLEYNWVLEDTGVSLSRYVDTMLEMITEGIKRGDN